MKRIFWRFVILSALASSANALDVDMVRFASAKENQARELAGRQTNAVPSIVWRFFDAVRVDDWKTATNLSALLEKASGRYTYSDTNSFAPSLRTPIWPTISETLGAYEQFHDWDNKWLHRFGREIIDSIPKGSIYFGGTDPGRFLISALSESQLAGKPFFTLTQNQLADGTYLDYLRTIYGEKLYIPTTNDSAKAFQDYVADAQQRQRIGQLKPGENVQTVDGRVQVSGQVAVMEINGLLVKVIMEKNASREIYYEESFALDRFYPQLSPYGLILRLHPKTLPGLSEALVEKDQEYWKKFVGELIGDWITGTTTVKDVCDFTEKIFRHKNLDGFKGDGGFAGNAESQKCFSKLRSSIGGLYAWRAGQAQDSDEKVRYQKAADLAFRQAFVLCPYSPEAVFRYVQFLETVKRRHDAVLVAQIASRMDPTSVPFRDLVQQLRQTE